MIKISSKLEIQLKHYIEEYNLEQYTDEIVAVARESICIYTTDSIDLLDIGKSRIGGAPDLHNKNQWPKVNHNHENGFFVFYLQINLEDLPKIDGINFPANGLISVFSTTQNQLNDEGYVVYNSTISDLTLQELPKLNQFADEDLDEENTIAVCFKQPKQLAFEKCISLPDYLFMPEAIEDDDADNYIDLVERLRSSGKGGEIGHLFLHPYDGLPEVDDNSWCSLLTLHSNSPYFNFGDMGNTAISIQRKQLEVGDFSKTVFNYCE